MAEKVSLEELLVNEIQARYDKKSDLASELMEVLSLNKDGVYRRLRFEKN